MKLYCLSSHPCRPCFILKFKGSAIMLDCSMDLSSILNFLPLPLVHSARLSNLAHWTVHHGGLDSSVLQKELRECEGRVFVDAEPEFAIPETALFDLSELDVILVSNHRCMMALPFITEFAGFKGVVYATEPTLQLGRLLMEELVKYIQRTPKTNATNLWKDPKVLRFLPSPLREAVSPNTWRKCYSLYSVQSCLSKIEKVAFNEPKDIFGSLQITAVSSGYCIGSCNWIVRTAYEKIVYLSGSSALTAHPLPMEQSSLKYSDVMIMTSLMQTPTANPDAMMGELCVNTAVTLKNGGNVLIPCCPSGVIYDLFECMSAHLDTVGLSLVPMYFISPVADNSLAFSNIYAEWLSSSKQSKVLIAECPFPHAEMIKSNRLKHYASVSDRFNVEMRTPCVVFTGHPSLRFGDAVHFMELWGSSSANTVIFTEPDFDFLDALAPYQPLSMKAFFCPIDTSLSYSQANKLIRELSPSHVVVPHQYTSPPLLLPNRQDLVVDCSQNLITFRASDVLNLPIKRQFERVEIAPELASKLEPKEIQPGLGITMVSGLLVADDNRFTLQDPSMCKQNLPISGAAAKSVYGGLDINDLVCRLKQKGLNAKVENVGEGHVVIELPNSNALIRIEHGSTHVVCQGNETLRTTLRDVLIQCLKRLP